MNIIYVLIPIAIILTIVGIYLFFWAVKSEQFTDLEKQGLSILFDEDEAKKTTNKQQSNPIKNEKDECNGQVHNKTPSDSTQTHHTSNDK